MFYSFQVSNTWIIFKLNNEFDYKLNVRSSLYCKKERSDQEEVIDIVYILLINMFLIL